MKARRLTEENDNAGELRINPIEMDKDEIDRQPKDFFQMHENEAQMSQHLLKKMIIENNEQIRRQRFRFDEIAYKHVFRFDLLMLGVQLIVSILYIGSWFTMGLVRIPRVLIGCVTTQCLVKISDLNRRTMFLKFEWIMRLVTVAIYFIVSFASSVYLPKQFCHLFDGIFSSTRDNETNITCVWQVFGFRMVFMLLYLPVEFLIYAVVYRHSKDLTFQLSLKRYMVPGMESEFLRIQMNSIAFRLNNEDEVDTLIGNNNPEEIRHAILRNKYRNAIMTKESQLVKMANQSGITSSSQPLGRPSRPTNKGYEMADLSSSRAGALENSEMKMLGDLNDSQQPVGEN